VHDPLAGVDHVDHSDRIPIWVRPSRSPTPYRTSDDMNAPFGLAQGVEVPNLSGIEEAYSVKLVPEGYHVFTINVSAEKIPTTFRRLASEVAEPAFFLFELPTHHDVEEQLRKSQSDPFHRDVYYLDGLTWPVAEDIFASYEFLLTHDGEANFGYGSHGGHDEVLVGAYKIFYVYADNSEKYHSALREFGYPEVPQVRTVWDNFTQQSPGRRNVLTKATPTIWQMADQLEEKGLYLAERRAD
jgi:hypothetical protein